MTEPIDLTDATNEVIRQTRYALEAAVPLLIAEVERRVRETIVRDAAAEVAIRLSAIDEHGYDDPYLTGALDAWRAAEKLARGGAA